MNRLIRTGALLLLLLPAAAACRAGDDEEPEEDVRPAAKGIHWINRSSMAWTVSIAPEAVDRSRFKDLKPKDPLTFPVWLALNANTPPQFHGVLGTAGQGRVQTVKLKPKMDAEVSVENNAADNVRMTKLTFSNGDAFIKFRFLALGHGRAKLILEKRSEGVDAADVLDGVQFNVPVNGSITFRDPPK